MNLTDDDKETQRIKSIPQLWESGLSIGRIAKIVHRSAGFVEAYLKDYTFKAQIMGGNFTFDPSENREDVSYEKPKRIRVTKAEAALRNIMARRVKKCQDDVKQ